MLLALEVLDLRTRTHHRRMVRYYIYELIRALSHVYPFNRRTPWRYLGLWSDQYTYDMRLLEAVLLGYPPAFLSFDVKKEKWMKELGSGDTANTYTLSQVAT